MKNNVKTLTILSMLMLTSCIRNDTSSSNNLSNSSNSSSSNLSSDISNSSSSYDIFTTDTKLLISEYVEGTGENNRAIEIYNFSDESVNLSEYEIAHYKREYTPDSTVKLSGTLNAKETYVVVTSSSSAELKEKADFVSEDLYFSGKGAVALMHNGKVCDSLGYISYYNAYAEDVTLVRKVEEEFFTPRGEYDPYDWIKYSPDNFKYLGNIETSVTEAELLKGPYLEDKYLDPAQYPFYVNDGYTNRGTGGAVKGSLKNNIDGDTSDIYVEGINPKDFMEDYYGTTNKGTWIRARYYAVDTPESGGNAGIQEFGMMAKYYTAYIQNQAENMYVQTISGDSLLGNFGRLLSYIWADRDTLVNFETIKAGYSIAVFDYHYDMTYKDLPYESYFYNANLYARKHKLGRYGERDPYWNYGSGKSYCETITCGNYFENNGSILG